MRYKKRSSFLCVTRMPTVQTLVFACMSRSTKDMVARYSSKKKKKSVTATVLTQIGAPWMETKHTHMWITCLKVEKNHHERVAE